MKDVPISNYENGCIGVADKYGGKRCLQTLFDSSLFLNISSFYLFSEQFLKIDTSQYALVASQLPFPVR